VELLLSVIYREAKINKETKKKEGRKRAGRFRGMVEVKDCRFYWWKKSPTSVTQKVARK
jgi:hypothetical protein